MRYAKYWSLVSRQILLAPVSDICANLRTAKMESEDAFKLVKVSATMGAGVMAGSALYINLVEHPARMKIDDVKSLHKQWKEGFDVAKKLMIGISLVPICGGVAAYAIDRSKGKPWLIAAGLLACNVPYTLLVIMPRSITPIHDYEVVAKKDPAVVKDTVEKWNTLHKVRTVVDIAAFAWCVYNLVYN